MDCIEDQQPTFKHYCRVCKKGFMCGRALGGHMRAHGIGDENGNLDEEDPTSDWEDKNDRTSNKRMYQLRTNPNRLKSCRICENCGKEFFSWKAFLEHGKCSSDAESLVSSPESEDEEDEGGGRQGGGGWTKRKRSMRAKVGSTIISSAYPSSEDEDLLLAKCLVQLANTRVELPMMVTEMESSSTSANREGEQRNAMDNFFSPRTSTPLDKAKRGSSNNSKGMFECKACKKVFNSHQALGGHRASHKKVKGCYAAKQDHDHQLDDHNLADDDMITHDEFFPASNSPYNSPNLQFEQGSTALVGAARRKSKVHECTICHRVFSSGQALGGHKRCHWITSNSPADTTKLQFHHHVEPINHYKPKIKNSDQALDLNLPAWADEMSGLRQDTRNPLSFEVSTDIHLHQWTNTGDEETVAKNIDSHLRQCNQINEDDNNKKNINGSLVDGNNNNSNNVTHYVDEADSRLRLAKLSDLKDMNLSGSSSQWLQVGIGSTTGATADP
ncbi:zinc finger protein ZAT9-like [Olea europaea var. sylvestris]|uniref:Zinc finger ZAT4-like n=1 Tax=Olea europaea subsp. europaea TaxID=158383 RepID=A0A8S0PQ04_OLEEU|nr:zinc finger protein ZAT9-like [Olea europaea var. sylvestris]CAA2954225.1 zinc finger ZAT4-like [Olea europaea subsp. europaea]